MADQHSALLDLIRRGRRRQISHLLFHAASFATVVAMAGAIVLLIVGAQILNWYWLVMLFAGSLAASAYRSRAKLLSAYQVAQSIDGQLDFKDALSTAYYFSHNRERAASPEFVDQQRQVAEDVARSADIERGVPFLMPRTVYVNVALVAVAFGMFGLRYGIHRSLDLSSPLVHITFDGLFGTSPQVADAKAGKRAGDGRHDPGAPVDPWEAKTNDLDPANDAALQSVNDPDPNSASTSPDASAKADAKSTEQVPPGTNPLDTGEKNDASDKSGENANSSAGADSKTGQQNGSKDAKDSKDGSQSASSGDNSSLGSKLRDALSNLLGEDEAAIQARRRKAERLVAIGEFKGIPAGRKAGRRFEIARPGAGRREREFAVRRRPAAGRDRASFARQERRTQQQSTQFARRQERHRQAGWRQGRARSG